MYVNKNKFLPLFLNCKFLVVFGWLGGFWVDLDELDWGVAGLCSLYNSAVFISKVFLVFLCEPINFSSLFIALVNEVNLSFTWSIRISLSSISFVNCFYRLKDNSNTWYCFFSFSCNSRIFLDCSSSNLSSEELWLA